MVLVAMTLIWVLNCSHWLSKTPNSPSEQLIVASLFIYFTTVVNLNKMTLIFSCICAPFAENPLIISLVPAHVPLSAATAV